MRALLERLAPPADRPVAGWHVSPFVDLVAYQFSWLWILIPLALAGDMHPKDYLGLWAFGMTVSFLHRHYTMPYVYLDKVVFGQHVTRFTLFAGLLMLGFVGSAFLFRWKAPPGFFKVVDVTLVLAGLALVAQTVVADRRGHRFSARSLVAVAAPFTIAVALGVLGLFVPHHLLIAALTLVAFAGASVVVGLEVGRSDAERARPAASLPVVIVASLAVCGLASLALEGDGGGLNAKAVKGSALVGLVGVFAALWNVWHTLMQKLGILRVYAAKSTVPLERRTPAWVDRLLIFGSFPFLALWLGPAQRDVITAQSKSVTQYLVPVIDVLEVVQPVLLPVGAGFWIFSVACFAFYERRADGLRSWPRLSMALALTALNASFLVLSPLKVYIAYGFSHGLEYMVFVWAFLRRRYAQPQPHRPLIQRLLERPVLFYGLFSLVIAAGFFFPTYGDDYGLHPGNIRFFDIKLGTWLFSFAIWHSMAHFYFDGFLWKMRAPQVRASL